MNRELRTGLAGFGRACWRGLLALGDALAEAEYEVVGERARSREAALTEERDRLKRETALHRFAAAEERRRAGRAERELALVVDLHGEVPGLTPAEIERLGMLIDKCGDVTQAAAKVLLHGWEGRSPFGAGRDNRGSLEREIGGVRAAVGLMLDARDVRLAELQAWQRRKTEKLGLWTHYQACSRDDSGVSGVSGVSR